MISPWASLRQGSVWAGWLAVAAATALAGEGGDRSGAAPGPQEGPAAGSIMRPSVIVAGRYVAPDGTLQANVAIVLVDGKIQSVAPAERYAGAKDIVRHSDGVVCPGLIDLRSSIGAHGKAVEQALAVDPAASAIDSLDRDHRDFRSAVRAGITTAVLTPAKNNLISGSAAVVKTAGLDGPGLVLRDDGPLMLALGPSVWQYDRAPTSRIGSLAMLRDTLDLARKGGGHERIAAFVHGKLNGIVACDEPMDVSAAVRSLSDIAGSISIAHTGDAHELTAEIAGSGRNVVIGPYSLDMSRRTLSGAAAFASAGVPVAFAAAMPEHAGDALRITAALAVRHGLDPAEARRAMTATAAVVAGVGDRVGAVRAGLDADLVVFSDDPLRLDSRVLEVYVDGGRVYAAGADGESLAGGGR